MSRIRVELQLDDGSFVTGMMRAGQSLDSFKRELERTNPHFRTLREESRGAIVSVERLDGSKRRMLSTMRDVAVVAGFVSLAFKTLTGNSNSLASQIISVNAEMERLKYQMVGMSQAPDPFEDARNSVQYLREMARDTPFALNTLTGAFTKLKATGMDPMNGSIQAIVDGVAALGGTDQQLHRLSIGLQQMMGKTVIQMEEMRQQVGEAMPGAIAIFARSMGVSIGELAKAIETGRVESRAALEKFFAEVNRMYGGEALRMMTTFSGQVSQLQANWQMLVTDENGAFKFFERIKVNLQELNQLLQSDRVSIWAEDLTDMAVAGVDAIQEFVNWLIKFRDEIKFLAASFAGLLAARIVIGVVGALMAQMVMLKASVVTLGGALAKTSAGLGLFSSMSAVASARAASTATSIGMMSAGIMGVGRAIAMALPGVALLGSGIYILMSYFDLLGSKSQKAYEDLKRFGAETRQEAEEIIKNIQERIARNITQLQSEMNAMGAMSGGVETAQMRQIQSKIDEYTQILREISAESNVLIEEAAVREANRELRRYELLLADAERKAQSQYRLEAANLSQWYVDAMQEAAEGERAFLEVREEYHERLIEIQSEMVKTRMRLYDDEMRAVNERERDELGRLSRHGEMQLEMLRNRRTEAAQELIRIREQEFGIYLLDAPESEEQKVARGGRALRDLRENIAELEVNIRGASGAYAVMLERISRGDYGDPLEDATGAVREMHAALLAATEQKEILDRLMTGQRRVDSDMDRIRREIQDRSIALMAQEEGRELNSAELALQRLQDGYYEGLGPIDNIRTAVQGVTESMAHQGEVAGQVARVMRENTFSNETVRSIETVDDAVGTLNESIEKLARFASGDLTGAFDGLVERVADVIDYLARMSGVSLPAGLMDALRGPQPVRRDFGIARTMGRMSVPDNMLELIAQAEGTANQPGGGYNTSLDYGRWLPGGREHNLTSMTIREVRQLQDYMRSHGENRRLYGNGAGSSAMGRYQIVSMTLDDLIRESLIDPNQPAIRDDDLFDEAMQDRLARMLLHRRRNQGLRGLRNEWEGLHRVPDEAINAVRGGQQGNFEGFVQTIQEAEFKAQELFTDLAQNVLGRAMRAGESFGQIWSREVTEQAEQQATQVQLPMIDIERVNRDIGMINERQEATRRIEGDLRGLSEQLNDIASRELDQRTRQFLQELQEQLERTTIEAAQAGEAVRRVEEAGRAGEIDPNSAVYQQILEFARKIDERNASINEELQLRQQLERDNLRFAEQAAEMAARIAEERRRADDPDWVPDPAQMRALNRELDTYVDNVRRIHGESSEQFRQAQEYRTQLLSGTMEAEAIRRRAAIEREIADLDDGLRSQLERRQASVQQRFAQIRAEADFMRRAGMDEIEITRWVEEQKAAVRAAYERQASPMTETMERWADLWGNVAQRSASWAENMASGVTNLIMGVGGVEQMINSIISDMVGMLVRFQMSNMWNMKGGEAKTPMPIGKGKMAGVAHTGGIVGSLSQHRKAHAGIFANAPKYHTGGIVGDKLLPSEVPIIAKKGEGIFTPEQMDALGGFQQNQVFEINAPITVNGSAGSAEQNQDLAEKMGMMLERRMRATVIEEIRKQTRPGNMLNSGR